MKSCLLHILLGSQRFARKHLLQTMQLRLCTSSLSSRLFLTILRDQHCICAMVRVLPSSCVTYPLFCLDFNFFAPCTLYCNELYLAAFCHLPVHRTVNLAILHAIFVTCKFSQMLKQVGVHSTRSSNLKCSQSKIKAPHDLAITFRLRGATTFTCCVS